MLGAFSKKSQSVHSHKTKISMEPVYSKFIKLTKCEIIHLHVHLPYILILKYLKTGLLMFAAFQDNLY